MEYNYIVEGELNPMSRPRKKPTLIPKLIKHTYGIGEEMKQDLAESMPSALSQLMRDVYNMQQKELIQKIFAEILFVEQTPENVAKLLFDVGAGRHVQYEDKIIGYLISETKFSEARNSYMHTTTFVRQVGRTV